MRMRQQDLPHPTKRMPGPSSGKGGPGRQIKQQRPVHKHGGSSPSINPERNGTGSTRTVRTRESSRGTGTEQSKFHAPIFTAH